MNRGKFPDHPFWVTLCIQFIFSLAVSAQISGIVTDSRTGKPIESVEVFLDQCSKSATTDPEGQFNLGGTVTGFVTLVLYKKDYELFRSPMRVQLGRAYTLNLSLTPDRKKSDASVQITMSDHFDTGYRVYTYEDRRLSQKKFTRYELSQDANLNQQVAWEKKRGELYDGSLRHWLTSMVNGTTSSEGFEISQNQNTIIPETLIKETSVPGYFRINLNQPVEIKYKGTVNELTASDALDVSELGFLLNEDVLRITGPMSSRRLPLDYFPLEEDVEEAYTRMVKSYFEKVYVHTDKPYYYQGEPVWFKAYINYYNVEMKDSLSRVLYVELISPKQEIVMEKILKIENGIAQGDFILPDTVRRGDYFLRAYTNLQRNFGDDKLYVKHIPILGITDKVDASQGNWESEKNDRVKITTDKESYTTREKITLTVSVKDEEGNPVAAHLAISVTDATQVVPIKIPTIANEFNIDEEDIDVPQMLKYQPEYGITLRGIYLNEQDKPAKTQLNLVQWQSSNVALVETEEDGRFEVIGFDFYDSTKIFYHSIDSKIEKGKVVPEQREIARVGKYENEFVPLQIMGAESPQRVISSYEVPKEARVLENVDITAPQFNVSRVERPYGTSRYGTVIEKRDINVAMGDLNFSLIGKVPGLIVQQAESGWNIRITRLGVLAGEPLVTVNDVPMFGRAGDIISMINPATVESIEIKKSINVMYGEQGAFGVIAIYTQPTESSLKGKAIESARSINIKGYSPPRNFLAPDHSSKKKDDEADLRSGLHWNPSITAGEDGTATVSFYATDLQTSCKIIVEGITSDNQPVYAEHFITIRNE